ncbi:hypothetical protein VB264_20455 [Arcicella aquatica]|uniref:Lipoprotein n=1 Tax=Arcicella aquatica TaxID=217141 RepID=A0ABU5QSV1_9BACT|nr:hypothetical protein [Arcicella aquatica]MEA5260182.1 hypothetical protein [Arcicella aquatica]
MKRLTLLLVSLMTLGMLSCSENGLETLNNPENVSAEKLDDYLVFSHVGLGWGCRASVIYMVTNSGKVYADTSGNFCKDQEKYSFVGYQLPDSEYAKVKNVITEFPADLANQASTTFGCPGCADGGMLLIQRKEKGKAIKTWRVDDSVFYRETDVNNQTFPTYLSKYGKILGPAYTSIKYK